MVYTLRTNRASNNRTPGARCPAVFGFPRTIDSITIHWWNDPALKPQFDGVVDWLCRPGGSSSAHEVIEAGLVARIVQAADAAWHAGNAKGNASSYGLELNPRASDEDYETAGERIADLWRQFGKKPILVKHSYWRNTACPGTYDLARLRRIADKYFGGNPTPPKPGPTTLAVDGFNGPASVRRYQTIAGTTVDGVISTPSQFTRWLQNWLNDKGYRDADGKRLVLDGYGFFQNLPAGRNTPSTKTQYALQRYLRTFNGAYVPDGMFSSPSIGVKIMQQAANDGNLFR